MLRRHFYGNDASLVHTVICNVVNDGFRFLSVISKRMTLWPVLARSVILPYADDDEKAPRGRSVILRVMTTRYHRASQRIEK